jgi:acyl carrier protein
MACQKNKGGLTTMSNRKIVMSTAQERRLSPLTDDLKLLESGLDSLSFAIIVARLEDSLGVDPFNADEAIDFPVTFGEFARLYEPRSP